MSYIVFHHVLKEYTTGGISIHALKDASFQVEKGELAVILGASGAGKTTALNILGGMDTATDGNVIVDGQDTEKSRPRRTNEKFSGTIVRGRTAESIHRPGYCKKSEIAAVR